MNCPDCGKKMEWDRCREMPINFTNSRGYSDSDYGAVEYYICPGCGRYVVPEQTGKVDLGK